MSTYSDALLAPPCSKSQNSMKRPLIVDGELAVEVNATEWAWSSPEYVVLEAGTMTVGEIEGSDGTALEMSS